MQGTRHFYFLDSIGGGNWFSYGTTLQDIRYAVEGYSCFDSEMAPDANLPAEVIFHYPACYGGEVFEGYSIYNYKRSLAARGVKTTSLIEGLCASIATLTALGSDTVLMSDAAFWMVHKPMVDAGPNANADEHAAAAVLLNKIQDQLAGRYVARSGGKLDSAGAHALMNQTSWLTADECLSYGFITGKVADAPLEAPAGAEKVLNYLSPTALKSTAPMATLNETEKKGFIAEIKALFGLKEAAPKAAAPKAETPATPPAAETTPPAAMLMTEFPLSDGTSIWVDNSDDNIADIENGDAVYVDEAMTTPVADGDYTLEDARDFTVVGGLVDGLSEAAAEAAPPATSPPAEARAAAAPKAMTPAARLKVAEARAAKAEARLAEVVPGSTGAPNKAGAQVFTDGGAAAAHPLDAAAEQVKAKLQRRF